MLLALHLITVLASLIAAGAALHAAWLLRKLEQPREQQKPARAQKTNSVGLNLDWDKPIGLRLRPSTGGPEWLKH